MKKIAVLLIALCGLFLYSVVGVGAETLPSSGSTGPSGNISCLSSTVTSNTIGVNYSNTGTSGARLYRFGAATYIANFAGPSGTSTHKDDGLAAGQTYTYELRTGMNSTSVILDRQTCTTQRLPSGNITCAGSTISSNTMTVNFSNADTAGVDVYRTGLASAIASFRTDNGSTTATDSGLGSGTAYTYQLRSGSRLLDTETCTTDTVANNSTAEPTPASSAPSTSGLPTSVPTSTTGSTSDTPSTSTGPANVSEERQVVRFNQQQVLKLSDGETAEAKLAEKQLQASLVGATGNTFKILVASIIILFVLCAFIIWRFSPMFARMDRDKSGLRRRILIIVTLPSLIPLLGLGFIGYQQLSKSVKHTLSSQLEKAASTSALKLDREFNIRRTVIVKTSSDILQIKSQYGDQRTILSAQKDRCATVVSTAVPFRQFSKVTSNDDCLPFLTGFAQLNSSSGSRVANYLSALDQGALQAFADITAQEDQRVGELLRSVRHLFPDVLELTVVDATPEATVKANLARVNSGQKSSAESHSDLLIQSVKESLVLYEKLPELNQLLLTYPVKNNGKVIGGAVVAIDTKNKNFIPAIWESTPKPYDEDKVFFVTTKGELVSPSSANQNIQQQLVALAKAPAGQDFSLKSEPSDLVTRTSPVLNTNWVVAVGAPASSVYAPLGGIQRTAMLAIFGFLLLSILLGIWFVGSIASEIERLLRGAQAFAKGDLNYRISLRSHDELQLLGETMNQMAVDIDVAQKALVEKDKEFINIATHELKAPMTSIIGNLSMVTEDGVGVVDDTAKQLIGQAYLGTVRLRDIVTDMLDIARLESGHDQLKIVPLDIVAMTKGIVDMQMVPAEQAGIKLIYEPSGVTPNVLADKNKLQIIITNFVSNAIKYNRPDGSVTVSHELKDGLLITSVKDTGLGIPEDQKSHMFEKFYRVQHDDRANVPGTGLGLHITKRFVETMGGTVSFTSTHGEGTTFYFSLPVNT